MGKFQLHKPGAPESGWAKIYPHTLDGLNGTETKVYIALAGSLSKTRHMAIVADEPLAKSVGLKRTRFNEAKQGLVRRGLIQDVGCTSYGSRVYKIFAIKNDFGGVSDEEWTEAVRIESELGQVGAELGPSRDQVGTEVVRDVQDLGQSGPSWDQNGTRLGQSGPSWDQNGTKLGRNVPDSVRNGDTYRQETRDKRRETKEISISPVPGSAKVKETGREVIKEMVSKNQNWKNSELSHADRMLSLMNGDTEGLKSICRDVTDGNEYYSNFKDDLEKRINGHLMEKNLSVGLGVRESIESFDHKGIETHPDIEDEHQKKIYGYVIENCGPEVKKMLDDSLNGLLHKFDSETVVNYIIQNA